jgi:hypothetical protein
MAGLLQPAQQHDRHQAARMQARRGAIESDISGNDAGCRQGIQGLDIGALMDEAAFADRPDKIRFVARHRRHPS